MQQQLSGVLGRYSNIGYFPPHRYLQAMDCCRVQTGMIPLTPDFLNTLQPLVQGPMGPPALEQQFDDMEM